MNSIFFPSTIGMGSKKKLAKHSSAHAVLQQIEATSVKRTVVENGIASLTSEMVKNEKNSHDVTDGPDAFNGESTADVSDTLVGSANDSIQDYIQMLDFSQTDVQQNEFAVIENVVTPDAEHKLASIIKRYIEIYAEDLQCSPKEYLAVVNHWRHPCDLTHLLSLWISSTLQCKVYELLAADVQHMGTSVLRANNLLITEANSHVLPTYYEFCVWTPICLSNNETDNADYFMISSTDACGNNTIRKHYPKVGESIVCHHSTKFRFRGSKHQNCNHFYVCTEWKRSTYDELDSMDRIISTTVPKSDHEKIQKTLLHGLRSIRGTKINYDLKRCVNEWQRMLYADNNLTEVDRIFIDNCVDSARVEQTLAKFLMTIEANERHNARDCDETIYQELSDQLLKPIEQFIIRE